MCSIFALFSTLFFITFFLDSFNALITSSHIIKAISIRMVYRVDLVPEHYIGFRITGVNRLVIKKTTHHTTKITSRATVVPKSDVGFIGLTVQVHLFLPPFSFFFTYCYAIVIPFSIIIPCGFFFLSMASTDQRRETLPDKHL